MIPGGSLRLPLATAVAVLCGIGIWIARPLPSGLLAPGATQSLTIEDRYGLVLRSTRASDGSLARWVTFDEMDPDLLRAFVAVEDQRFYQHHGIDPRSVGRALRDNVKSGHVVSGASTITMQLARLTRPLDRSWLGKMGQALWALRLEAHLTKQQILEQYLNRVPLGQGAVGVASAAALYFGAAPSQLSLGQAALLAALARTPSSQNPLVDPLRARWRRAIGLELLLQSGYITNEELVRASAEPVIGGDRLQPFLAPHFTSQILQWAEHDSLTFNGTWRTSLDLELQAGLESEVRHTVDQLADRGVKQAAAVVLDNRSGEILAWVGSPDFWADTAGQVDMVVNLRQPGSALKPFLYALAFDRGATPATVLADVAKTYQTSGGPYHPRNYDRSYHGPVRAREALGSSYNVPAVEVADRIGYATLLHGLHEAGFGSLNRNAEFYGLGLALGNGDVSLLELANGYRALANGGIWRGYTWKSDAAAGGRWAGPERRFVSPRAAAMVLDILSDPGARLPAFGTSTPFDFPFRVAAKSGTSRHFTDNWAVATTANFTVAVWAGNFSGRPMEGVSGVTGAGPLLHRAVLVVAKRYSPGNLIQPSEAGLVPIRICRLSGMRATPDCPGMTEWFKPEALPSQICDWHQGKRVRLPEEYAEWERTDGQTDGRTGGQTDRRSAADRLLTVRPSDRPTPPSGPSARLSTPTVRPSVHLSITSPQDGDHYRLPPGVDAQYATVALRASGAPEHVAVRWYVDGHPTIDSRWKLVPGSHRFRAEAVGLSAEVSVVVEE